MARRILASALCVAAVGSLVAMVVACSSSSSGNEGADSGGGQQEGGSSGGGEGGDGSSGVAEGGADSSRVGLDAATEAGCADPLATFNGSMTQACAQCFNDQCAASIAALCGPSSCITCSTAVASCIQSSCPSCLPVRDAGLDPCGMLASCGGCTIVSASQTAPCNDALNNANANACDGYLSTLRANALCP